MTILSNYLNHQDLSTSKRNTLGISLKDRLKNIYHIIDISTPRAVLRNW